MEQRGLRHQPLEWHKLPKRAGYQGCEAWGGTARLPTMDFDFDYAVDSALASAFEGNAANDGAGDGSAVTRAPSKCVCCVLRAA